MSRQPTKTRIAETADTLFYQRGYAQTSLADIAQEIEISRGNFYYHFKSKDEILGAVLKNRHAKTVAMLETFQAENDTAAGRISAFVHILTSNQANIMQFGCPVGTICGELGKLAHPARAEASEIFSLFREWLAEQFAALGYVTTADDLAMHLLARSQGIATLAQAFQDPEFVAKEVAVLERWLTNPTL